MKLFDKDRRGPSWYSLRYADIFPTRTPIGHDDFWREDISRLSA